MSNLLIINGNPKGKSFCRALAESYAEGAREAGGEVELIHIADMDFDPNLKEGYDEVQELEEDLLSLRRSVEGASHMVIVTPTWWGSVPAVLKGLFDRLLLPGVAFSFDPGKVFPNKLLDGRTARLIVTANAPVWFHRFVSGDPVVRVLKPLVLGFCGVRVTDVSRFGPVKGAPEKLRTRWLHRVRHDGAVDARKKSGSRTRRVA